MDAHPSPPSQAAVSGSPRCQLEAFYVTKLSLNRPLGLKEPKGDVDQFALGFQLGIDDHLDDPTRFRLFLRIKASASSGSSEDIGLEIESRMWGYFAIVETVPVEDRKAVVRLEGSAMLYDILKGIVITSTGCFPEGRYLLPSILATDIVKLAEKTEKTEKTEKKSPSAKRQKKSQR